MSIAHKVARICWNTRYWKCPSGADGKSKNEDSYEWNNHFGHEEWLFDVEKVYKGYHYAYIQAIATNRDAYLGQTFDLSLYSINSETKERFWLGTINNIEVVDEIESEKVYRHYKDTGWLDEMVFQLRGVQANAEAFEKDAQPGVFAVLKYKPEELRLLEEPLEFKRGDPAVKADYYNLKNYVSEPLGLHPFTKFSFTSGHNKAVRGRTASYSEHTRDLNDLHAVIQDKLYTALSNRYGKQNVGTEHNTGAFSRVDVVVKDGDNFIFYEIKTSLTLMSCIRDAIGQLLEYRYQVGKVKVPKLIIVSQHPPDNETESYLKSLRDDHDIPVFYEQCSV